MFDDDEWPADERIEADRSEWLSESGLPFRVDYSIIRPARGCDDLPCVVLDAAYIGGLSLNRSAVAAMVGAATLEGWEMAAAQRAAE